MRIKTKTLEGEIVKDKHYYFVRVFHEDTDAGQIVYHTNYLKYFERARTSLLNLLKIDQINLKKNHDTFFVVRKANINWFKPAVLNDTLLIETCLKYAKNSSITLVQSAYRCCEKNKKNELLVSGNIQVVAINTCYKVKRIKKILKSTFFQNKLK